MVFDGGERGREGSKHAEDESNEQRMNNYAHMTISVAV